MEHDHLSRHVLDCDGYFPFFYPDIILHGDGDDLVTAGFTDNLPKAGFVAINVITVASLQFGSLNWLLSWPAATRAHTHTHIHSNENTHVCEQTHIWVCTNACVCTHARTQASKHVHTHTAGLPRMLPSSVFVCFCTHGFACTLVLHNIPSLN